MIVLDDLGFAQLGCYGSDIASPSIDRLAEHGLRYNNFHVTALCAPTRACLLTGRNHHAVGMGFFPEIPMGFPGYTGRNPPSAATLPRLLRDAGYSTFAVGKWHHTPQFERSPAGPFDLWPLGMGFERYYGFHGGETNQWTPDLVRDNGFIEPPLPPEDGYHLTEDLASQAIRFVQDQQQAVPDKPFFLYFATGATHAPHQVPSAWVEPYRNRFDDGWEAWRHRTFLKQQQQGVVPADASLTERPSWVYEWDGGLSSDERRLFARQMEVYAGFLTHTDAQIGRLMDFLAAIEVLDNTLVFIVSDNGASAEGGPHGSFSRSEIDNAELMSRIDDLGGFRAFNHYAWGWAWAGNTPFKLWKRYAWLGGVRVPLIIQWPAGISAEDNRQVRTQFCHAIDLMPSILDATGVEIPDVLDGVSQQSLDGKSLLPTLGDADSPSPRTTQYFEAMGSCAIYHDGWKATTDHVNSLISADRELIDGSHDFETDRWSLFSLEKDFSEANDVAAADPDQLRQMIELWWFEAGRNQVLPLMDDIIERATARELSPYAARYKNVYLPSGGPIVAPSPFLAGFCLAADIAVPEDRDTAGIICAQGDWHGGWACYVLDGRLIVTFNFGRTPQQVVARESITAGRHEVGIKYLPGSEGTGSASITVDGREVGTEPVSAEQSGLRRFLVGLYGMKLLVGRDRGFPVCDDYRPPFPFTGHIHRVVFEVPTPPAPTNSREEITNALRHD